MKCFKSIRVGHKIKLEPIDDLMKTFPSGKLKPVRITHKIKLKPMKPMKPMKILKKLMNFWG